MVSEVPAWTALGTYLRGRPRGCGLEVPELPWLMCLPSRLHWARLLAEAASAPGHHFRGPLPWEVASSARSSGEPV